MHSVISVVGEAVGDDDSELCAGTSPIAVIVSHALPSVGSHRLVDSAENLVCDRIRDLIGVVGGVDGNL